jgi:hypothetical protein
MEFHVWRSLDASSVYSSPAEVDLWRSVVLPITCKSGTTMQSIELLRRYIIRSLFLSRERNQKIKHTSFIFAKIPCNNLIQKPNSHQVIDIYTDLIREYH